MSMPYLRLGQFLIAAAFLLKATSMPLLLPGILSLTEQTRRLAIHHRQ